MGMTIIILFPLFLLVLFAIAAIVDDMKTDFDNRKRAREKKKEHSSGEEMRWHGLGETLYRTRGGRYILYSSFNPRGVPTYTCISKEEGERWLEENNYSL